MKLKADQFHQTDTNRLELKRGGGCIGCFGVPFFLAGIFMFFIGMTIIPISNASALPWWAWILLLGMGAIFAAAGIGFMFGRNWITLDNLNGRIWTAWGLLRPMRGQSYFLKDYEKVVTYYSPGDSKTPPSYSIVLKSLMGGELRMLSSSDFVLAHNQALLLMNFLNLPLEDNSSEHTVIVKPGIVATEELTVRGIRAVPKPEFLTCDIRTDENGLHIKVPAAPFSPFSLLGLFFPLIIALIFITNMLMFFRGNQAPLALKMIFVGFIGLFFILIPAVVVFKRYLASHGIAMEVTVDKNGIVILQNRQSKTIGRESILSLDYGTVETAFDTVASSNGQANGYISSPWMARIQRFARSKGVTVKTREGEIYIGAGLPDAEVEYLYYLISRYFIES